MTKFSDLVFNALYFLQMVNISFDYLPSTEGVFSINIHNLLVQGGKKPFVSGLWFHHQGLRFFIQTITNIDTSSVSIMAIVGINRIWSGGVCSRLLWQINTCCLWALAWSNQASIISLIIRLFLCVTFTVFCTSFPTTKTQLPLLCRQRILTYCQCVF